MSKQLTKPELLSLTKGDVPSASREEKQVGTNCEGFRVNLIKGGKPVTYFMKKSFLKNLPEIIEDYELLKKTLKNLVPNTVFILGKDGVIFSFSQPVIIEFDTLEEKNKDFFILLLQDDEKLVKQLIFFIRKFRELEVQGNILDLYGGENLVYTKDDKLKYIDNYVVFAKNQTVIDASLQKIEYLEQILTTIKQ